MYGFGFTSRAIAVLNTNLGVASINVHYTDRVHRFRLGRKVENYRPAERIVIRLLHKCIALLDDEHIARGTQFSLNMPGAPPIPTPGPPQPSFGLPRSGSP